MQIAQILMILTAAGMGLRSFPRYGRPVRAAGAAIAGFLLWPVMAAVLFFMIVSAALASTTPRPTRW
ncbi:hypothetical protein GS491_26585 [Rhodococcus hoagii]|nr:hypothetical protein [Prescottella equi]NKR80688.1 hypothetical protein [Prescottella equi]NKS99566.1 hypothetical protein [Prescottella equi]